MKYFLIAGEASGDLHASNLMKALSGCDPQASFAFAGGDLMSKAAGKNPVVHYKDMAYMGITDVLLHLREIRNNFRKIKEAVNRFQPDALILVDYPGFNLRMAKWAKRQGFKVIYYISPKLWAWKESRVEIIRRFVDKLFLILPFEKDFYAKHEIDAEYVGNPVVDAVENFKKSNPEKIESQKPLIALLPGSRKQEIQRMLPVMSQLPRKFPAYDFVIAGAPGLSEELYRQYGAENIPVLFGKTYQILNSAYAAVVTSGTATLETALFKVPQIAGYRTNALQYHIGKHLVHIDFFSLVNLILGKKAIPELLQNEFNIEKITRHLKEITDENHRNKMLADYEELSRILGNRSASAETAKRIIAFLNAG